MTIGAFAILIVLRRQGLIGDELDDLNGLIKRSPAAAVLLLIFMLSLAGIPPLAGFVGKYYILLALIQTAALLPGASSARSTSFPRCTTTSGSWCMPGCASPDKLRRATVTPGQSVALAVMCFVTLVAGIYPEPFIRMATYSLTLPAALFGRYNRRDSQPPPRPAANRTGSPASSPTSWTCRSCWSERGDRRRPRLFPGQRFDTSPIFTLCSARWDSRRGCMK